MKIASIAPLLLLLSACGGVYKVSTDPESGGVPFFPIISVDATSMTFEQRWAEVELAVVYQPEMPEASDAAKPAAGASPGKKGEKIDKSAAAGAEGGAGTNEAKPKQVDDKPQFKTRQIRYLNDIGYANTLLKIFNEESTPIAASEKLSLRFKNDPDKKFVIEEPAPLAITDAIKLGPSSVERWREQVPATKPLYLNVPIPAGGSGSAAIELNPNGTLAKGRGNVKNELTMTLFKAAGSIISSIFGPAASSQGAGGVPIVDARMRVTVVRRVYMVTVRRPSLDPTPCDIASLLKVDPIIGPPPNGGACSASFTSVVLRGEDIDLPQTLQPPVDINSSAEQSDSAGKRQ